jgi:hypothetical protein
MIKLRKNKLKNKKKHIISVGKLVKTMNRVNRASTSNQ